MTHSHNNSVTIKKDELQILINMIKGHGITLEYPLYKLKMIQARASGDGYNLHILTDEKDFDELTHTTENYNDEMPSYNDIGYCLLLGGIIQYNNIDEFYEQLTLYKKMNKTIRFALDTNMFYQGFPSRSKLPGDTCYLLVDIVYEEMEAAINHKYSQNQINAMQHNAPYHKDLLTELLNRKTKKARKAVYVAMSEYRSIREQTREIKSPDPSTYDKEANDLLIVRTVRDYDEKNNMAVLLTADTNVSYLCEGKGPECFHFTYPSMFDVKHCSSGQLIELIFSFAIVCGFIQCNYVVIYGEYAHKTGNDDTLKLKFHDEEKYLDFIKDLEICRKLTKLGIEK